MLPALVTESPSCICKASLDIHYGNDDDGGVMDEDDDDDDDDDHNNLGVGDCSD